MNVRHALYKPLLIIFLMAVSMPSFALTQIEVDKLLASDAAYGKMFGASVSIDGDTALIGAPTSLMQDVGPEAAYVFVRNDGVWTEQAKLLPSDGAPSLFGASVSLDGDTAVIGARIDKNSTGAAYVFVRTDGAWTEQAKLLASDGVQGDRFGHSVSIDGDTTLIGAHSDDDNTGSAYAFVRTGSVWSEQAKLLASDRTPLDWFGFSASVDGNTAMIGAVGDNDYTGAVYVFLRTGDVWTEQTKLLPNDGAPAEFGASVSVDGDTAVIGARHDDDNGDSAGATYVFVRNGGLWAEQAKLLASDGVPGDWFGYSVSVDGDTAVIGAPYPYGDDNGETAGSAYVYARTHDVWTEEAKLLPIDGVPELFGASVSVDGNTVVIGDSNDDENGYDAGAAYIFALQSKVTIDIKPHKKPENVINLMKGKNLKVAIVGTADFDALQIDPSTVKFGPSEASPIRYKGKDYNKDGFSDLILTFTLEETGIACGDTEATLTGQKFPDPVIYIAGTDSFTVEPCQ